MQTSLHGPLPSPHTMPQAHDNAHIDIPTERSVAVRSLHAHLYAKRLANGRDRSYAHLEVQRFYLVRDRNTRATSLWPLPRCVADWQHLPARARHPHRTRPQVRLQCADSRVQARPAVAASYGFTDKFRALDTVSQRKVRTRQHVAFRFYYRFYTCCGVNWPDEKCVRFAWRLTLPSAHS